MNKPTNPTELANAIAERSQRLIDIGAKKTQLFEDERIARSELNMLLDQLKQMDGSRAQATGKRRGRPPGSKNKTAPAATGKRRGRGQQTSNSVQPSAGQA